ncbi:hypothetical protein I79_021410 [Cricetulus griseus]|uniref:Uncharacterized protein n=1 Tax=Cricetulus griseus TaxID=10029 RepID=G3ICL2_CRIGR|nr:hypothetical protein I79_021410 [Cricetulus griseus]
MATQGGRVTPRDLGPAPCSVPCLANTGSSARRNMHIPTRDPEVSPGSAATRASKTRTPPPHLVRSTAGVLPRRRAPDPRAQDVPHRGSRDPAAGAQRNPRSGGFGAGQGGRPVRSHPREEPDPRDSAHSAPAPPRVTLSVKAARANENPSPRTRTPHAPANRRVGGSGMICMGFEGLRQ